MALNEIYFWIILKSEQKIAVNWNYFERSKKWTWKIGEENKILKIIYKWQKKKAKKKRKTERIWNMNKFEIFINLKLNNFVFEKIQNLNEIWIWTNSKSEEKKKKKNERNKNEKQKKMKETEKKTKKKWKKKKEKKRKKKKETKKQQLGRSIGALSGAREGPLVRGVRGARPFCR